MKGQAMANSRGLLFDPNAYNPSQFDPETRRQLRAVIDWFEGRGKSKLLRDDLEAAWVSDFLDFIKQERVFATFLTPSEYGRGDPNKRWDTSRNAALSEIFDSGAQDLATLSVAARQVRSMVSGVSTPSEVVR